MAQRVTDASDPALKDLTAWTATDAAGAFALPALDPGSYLVTAIADGFVSMTLGPVAAGAAEALRFELVRGGTIRAHVVGP